MTDFEDANDNEGSLLVIRLATLCLEAGWYSWLRAAAISVIMLSHCNFKRNHTLFRRGFHENYARSFVSGEDSLVAKAHPAESGRGGGQSKPQLPHKLLSARWNGVIRHG